MASAATPQPAPNQWPCDDSGILDVCATSVACADLMACTDVMASADLVACDNVLLLPPPTPYFY